MNDNALFKKRIHELSSRSYLKGYTTFTDFLNLDEISQLKSEKLESHYSLFGGYANADRCIAGFGEKIESVEFPISCIEITPLQKKFADKLTHRDFLGSLMNLGINRGVIGDIIITENSGYVFCLSSMAQYIIDSVSRIKHTSVSCKLVDELPEILSKEPESTEIIVSSQRVDVIVASVYNLSRNKASQLINQEKIFINSRVAYKDSLTLKDGDVVSVRGYGKFIYCNTLRTTKKGKSVTEIKIYK